MSEPQRTFGDLLAEAVRLVREGAPGVGRRLRGEFGRAGLMAPRAEVVMPPPMTPDEPAAMRRAAGLPAAECPCSSTVPEKRGSLHATDDLRRLPVREPNGRRVLPRHARSRREPSLLDSPESDEWFVNAAGMIVDDTGRRV